MRTSDVRQQHLLSASFAGMIVSFSLWLGFLVAVHAATAPCSHLGSESAFLTQVLAELPQPVLFSFCDIKTGSQSTVHPDETGVSHFVLPGLIPKQLLGEENYEWKLVREGEQLVGSLDSEPAVLHLWLRAACIGQVLGMSVAWCCLFNCSYVLLQSPAHCTHSISDIFERVFREETTVRGFGMLQGNAPSKESIHGEFELDLQLVNLPGMPSQQRSFKVFWRDANEYTRFHSPFTVETIFPFEDTATHYNIRVGGFSDQAHLTFTPHISSCQPQVVRHNPVLLTVIPHSYVSSDSPANLELMAKILIAHVNHHLKLGLAGTLHYEVEPYLSYLANHTGTQALIQQGTLRLIGWDLEIQLEDAFGILLTHNIWHKDRSKVLQYNHAMLAHWGLDVYINPLDNDELLATSKPTNVSQMLSNGCIMPEGHTTAMRYDIRCGTCNTTEGNLWLSEQTTSPLAHYNETDWRVRLRGKPVLHADNTFSMAIHEAGVFHGGREHNSDCFFHVHMVNMFSTRRDKSDTEGFTSDVSWNWAL